MYEKELVLEVLVRIEESIFQLSEWTRNVTNADDFSSSPDGMILLNAVCMKLLAIGEEVKGLDKRTDKKLLNQYPSVPWKEVMGLRDIIAHHYFEVDPNEIFTVIKVDIPPLLEIVKMIKKDIEPGID